VVSSALDPLNIFIVGLGGAFLIPLLNRFGRSWPAAAFLFALTAMTMISGVSLWRLSSGAAPIAILTGGADAPYAINLRIDLLEAVFAFAISVVALVGARGFARGSYSAMLLYLLLIIGIQGMVMTRDLFNLFVFLEVVSIATYGLLSLQDTPAALAAAFKYLMATVLASTFFLMGTMLLYAATGMLNIDDLIVRPQPIGGPVEFAALMFVLACLLLELKPFPANGWGLDVYETARSDVAALIAGGVSAGVFFALLKLMPLFNDKLELIAGLSGVTFVFSNLIGLRQTKTQRLLGYSSIGQMALLTLAACLLKRLQVESSIFYLVVAGLFVNHLLAKVGLFWLAGHVNGKYLIDWSRLSAQPDAILLLAVLLAAICGFPPFPGFWAKWQLVVSLAAGERFVWIAIVLIGSLLEVAYLFRWFGDRQCTEQNSRPSGCDRRSTATRVGDGRTADRMWLSGGGTCRDRLVVVVRAAGGRARALSARARAGAAQWWRDAGTCVDRRRLAHPRPIGHQCSVCSSLARRWAGRIDRRSRTTRLSVGLPPASRRHASVAVGAPARLDELAVFLHLGTDYSLVLFPHPAPSQGRSACLALPAILVASRVLPACRLRPDASRRRHCVAHDPARGRA
jgi:formate hydrogenlyase subunit 3/multisubunit Na+/H+ antiporter MnhD subunit